MDRRSKFAALAVAALTMLLAIQGARAEEGPFPIWRAPMLDLASLEGIDARLARPLWAHRNGLKVYKEWHDGWRYAVMNNCHSVSTLHAQGYYPVVGREYGLMMYEVARCRAIEMLKRAKPARRSFVRDFRLDEKAPDVLPAFLMKNASCDRRCDLLRANRERVPLSEYGQIVAVKELGANDVRYDTCTWAMRMKIAARADVDGDGLEDLLLVISSGATQGTEKAGGLFVLTRDSSEGVLRVVEPESHLCEFRDCDMTFEMAPLSRC